MRTEEENILLRSVVKTMRQFFITSIHWRGFWDDFKMNAKHDSNDANNCQKLAEWLDDLDKNYPLIKDLK